MFPCIIILKARNLAFVFPIPKVRAPASLAGGQAYEGEVVQKRGFHRRFSPDRIRGVRELGSENYIFIFANLWQNLYFLPLQTQTKYRHSQAVAGIGHQ